MYYSEGMVDRFYNVEDIIRMYSYLSDIGTEKITIPESYHYNERSKNLFISVGFVKNDEDKRSQKFELLLSE